MLSLPSPGRSVVLPKVEKGSHERGDKKNKLGEKRDPSPDREKGRRFSQLRTWCLFRYLGRTDTVRSEDWK